MNNRTRRFALVYCISSIMTDCCAHVYVRIEISSLCCFLQHIHLDQLSVSYRRNGPDESFRFVLQSIQIDNQLITSSNPVAFSQTLQPSQESAGSRSDSSDSASLTQIKPILEIRLEKLNQNVQTGHVRYFTLLLQEVDLVLEKQFLDIMLQWYNGTILLILSCNPYLNEAQQLRLKFTGTRTSHISATDTPVEILQKLAMHTGLATQMYS